MKRRSIFLLILIVTICIGATVAYKIWNQPFKDPLRGTATRITAKQLFSDFKTDEQVAQKKYVPQKLGDKKLEITGEISEIGKNEDNEIYYMLKTEDEMFGVKCIMEKGEKSENAKAGSSLIVRGFCTGYNMDVIVNRCKIVK